MGRPPVPKPLLMLAVVAFVFSAVLLIMGYDAIQAATSMDTWPNHGHLSWAYITNCTPGDPEHPHAQTKPDDADPFTLHMFFMLLAFGFFGPASSVMYYVLEDALHMNHDVVKWIHAAVQTAALICSVLGFVQAYYANGGWCENLSAAAEKATALGPHFLSLHSMVGIVVLVGYWLQGPLALLFFSNKVLLKPGTAARMAFLKVHQIAGVGLTLLGLVVIIMGIMAFEAKRNDWATENSWLSFVDPRYKPNGISSTNYMTIWFKFARTGMVAFGLLLILGLVHGLKPAPAPAMGKQVAASDGAPPGTVPLMMPPQ